MTRTMQEVYDYALSLFGLPYAWGSDGPDKYDCSGLVQAILKFAQIDPAGDQTAHGLYQHFLKEGIPNSYGLGALAFYGTQEKIIHVGFCLDKKIMINASGGGSHVRTVIEAKRVNASVKIEPIQWRHNLVAVIMPQYWIKGVV